MPEAPNGLDIVLNDTLRDCACAALYHACQICKYHSSVKTQIASDADVRMHCVILPGYDAKGATVISWDESFKMTPVFFEKYAYQAYAIADRAWTNG